MRTFKILVHYFDHLKQPHFTDEQEFGAKITQVSARFANLLMLWLRPRNLGDVAQFHTVQKFRSPSQVSKGSVEKSYIAQSYERFGLSDFWDTLHSRAESFQKTLKERQSAIKPFRGILKVLTKVRVFRPWCLENARDRVKCYIS